MKNTSVQKKKKEIDGLNHFDRNMKLFFLKRHFYISTNVWNYLEAVILIITNNHKTWKYKEH